MLCPRLSSAVSVWFLIACKYNTIKKIVSLYFCTDCLSVLFGIVQRRELILGHRAM